MVLPPHQTDFDSQPVGTKLFLCNSLPFKRHLQTMGLHLHAFYHHIGCLCVLNEKQQPCHSYAAFGQCLQFFFPDGNFPALPLALKTSTFESFFYIEDLIFRAQESASREAHHEQDYLTTLLYLVKWLWVKT